MAITRMLETADEARLRVLQGIGDISGYEVFYHRILVGQYLRPEKTAGGILLPEGKGTTREEDRWQGKAVLVLKIAPGAFRDVGGLYESNYYGQRVEVGDWVLVKPTDGWQQLVNDWPCKTIEDSMIMARVSRPDIVF